ncbi:MAG: sarcosine oxidase subunit delta [Gammaproteobacteria bacterium]|nr:sarcosine oxidase subunit delta [Gammaproteobacteria bacterium]
MLLIECPWCGPRAEPEFSYGGEAHITRPENPDALSDSEWADYLFMRSNPRGAHLEQWHHSAGCRRWFNVERDTVSYKIIRVYKPGEPRPNNAKRAENHDG